MALAGFTEVTPGVRAEAIKTIEARGYQAIIPDGEGNNIDTIWAVSPGLQVDAPVQMCRPRTSCRAVSQAGLVLVKNGMQECTQLPSPLRTATVFVASTERLAPPILGKKARHQHVARMATILDQHAPPDPTVDVDVNGGDQNHANGPEEMDVKLWESRGFTPVVEAGTST